MNRKNAEVFMDLAQHYASNYECASNENNGTYGKVEIMDALLLMNNFSRQTNGDVSIEMVKGFLAEGHGEAILLLIGDERTEAKELLIDCILNPKLNYLFYEPSLWENHLKDIKTLKQNFGPVLVLISTNPDPFLTDGDCISGFNELIDYASGKSRLGIKCGHNDEVLKTILEMLQAHGTFQCNQQDMLPKFTRAFLAETWPYEDINLDVVECSALEVDTWKNAVDEWHVRMSYPGYDGEKQTFDLGDMFNGNETHIMISDPENLESRLKELAESFDFTGIYDGEDKHLLFAQPDKLGKLMEERDKR